MFYDTSRLAPCMNVLFWGSGDFPLNYSNRVTSWNAWNRLSGSVVVDTGTLFRNMKSPSHECLMTFWPLIGYIHSSTDQIFSCFFFHQFYYLLTDIDLHQITSCFHEAFTTVVACQQRTLNLLDTWPRLPVWSLLMLQCWDYSSRTCRIFLDFTPWLPLGTFLFLLAFTNIMRDTLPNSRCLH